MFAVCHCLVTFFLVGGGGEGHEVIFEMSSQNQRLSGKSETAVAAFWSVSDYFKKFPKIQVLITIMLRVCIFRT